MLHNTRSQLAGKTVTLRIKTPGPPGISPQDGDKFRVEDWWDRISDGTPWGDCNGNPAAMNYGFRAGMTGIRPDNEVLYGKVGVLGYIVHVTEIVEEGVTHNGKPNPSSPSAL